jgi:predicted nucleic acid-binding protein
MVFEEPEADAAQRALEGAETFAPTLIDYEIASVALKKARRRPEMIEMIGEALTRMSSLPIRRVSVHPTDTFALARQVHLTVYDAAYLWVARSMGCQLVSFDRRLTRVAAALGVAS